jgi:PAS domain S-box-containing protein
MSEDQAPKAHPASPALGEREAARLAALASYEILDTPRELAFDDLVELAAEICDAPMAAISLVAETRQWFKAEVGLGIAGTPIEPAFCAHTILEAAWLEVPDTTRDPRFDCNPLVTGAPGVRFYAGVQLKTADGLPLGALCVLDTRPRRLLEGQARALRRLGQQAMAQLELRRALRARTVSEGRFRALVDTSAQIVWTTDALGRAVEDSPSWRAYTGQSIEVWTGGGWLQAVHPEDRTPAARRWGEAVRLCKPIDAEVRLHHAATGTWRLTRVRAVPLRDEVSRVTSWVGMNIDIEDQRRMEAALAESEARFRRMADEAPVAIWTTGPDGGCSFMSETWRELTGQAPERAARWGWLTPLHPDDIRHSTATLLAANARQESFSFDYRLRSPGGGHRWATRTGQPRRGPDGTFLGHSGVDIDIHDRKEAEERLRLIVENARDYAILTADMEGRIDSWMPGATAVFGWEAAEAIGQPIDMLYTPEDRAAGVPGEEMRTARGSGRAPDIRWHIRKDGGRVFIDGSAVALRGPGGTVRGILKIGQDVTARKAAEDRQTLLAREVDHRAKNALAVVQAVLRLTRAPDIQAFTRAVEGRIGALARAQTLLSAVRWEEAGVRTLLEGELMPFLNGQRVMLEGPEVVLPPGMAQPLAMAVHELATNAVKHGALSVSGGCVSVSWHTEQEPARLLRLRWVERGGPPAAGPPSERGFGSRVLDGTLRRQLGGTLTLGWESLGLICEIAVPLGRVGGTATPIGTGGADVDDSGTKSG